MSRRRTPRLDAAGAPMSPGRRSRAKKVRSYLRHKQTQHARAVRLTAEAKVNEEKFLAEQPKRPAQRHRPRSTNPRPAARPTYADAEVAQVFRTGERRLTVVVDDLAQGLTKFGTEEVPIPERIGHACPQPRSCTLSPLECGDYEWM